MTEIIIPSIGFTKTERYSGCSSSFQNFVFRHRPQSPKCSRRSMSMPSLGTGHLAAGDEPVPMLQDPGSFLLVARLDEHRGGSGDEREVVVSRPDQVPAARGRKRGLRHRGLPADDRMRPHGPSIFLEAPRTEELNPVS